MSVEPPHVSYGVPPQVEASFVLGGRDFDPNRVTEILGCEPSTIWQQRHEHLRARRDLDNVQWVKTVGPHACYSVSEVVEQLASTIIPIAPKLPTVVAELNLKASVVATVRIREDRPLYELSQRALALLATLSCEFVLDIYDHTHEG